MHICRLPRHFYIHIRNVLFSQLQNQKIKLEKELNMWNDLSFQLQKFLSSELKKKTIGLKENASKNALKNASAERDLQPVPQVDVPSDPQESQKETENETEKEKEKGTVEELQTEQEEHQHISALQFREDGVSDLFCFSLFSH